MENFVDNRGFVVVNVAVHLQVAGNSTLRSLDLMACLVGVSVGVGTGVGVSVGVGTGMGV